MITRFLKNAALALTQEWLSVSVTEHTAVARLHSPIDVTLRVRLYFEHDAKESIAGEVFRWRDCTQNDLAAAKEDGKPSLFAEQGDPIAPKMPRLFDVRIKGLRVDAHTESARKRFCLALDEYERPLYDRYLAEKAAKEAAAQRPS